MWENKSGNSDSSTIYLGLRNRYIADIKYTQRNVLIDHVKYHGVSKVM